MLAVLISCQMIIISWSVNNLTTETSVVVMDTTTSLLETPHVTLYEGTYIEFSKIAANHPELTG